MVASVQLKTFGVTVECARSGLALRKRALDFALNVPILKTLRALDMKDCAKAAREGEKTPEKRSCESKRGTPTVGSRSKTGSGGAVHVAVACGGSKRLAFNAVSPLVDVRCL
jgi:hypothetical protein